MLLMLLASAFAADTIPARSVTYESLGAVRLNPLGLQESFGLYARARLQDSDSVLFQNTYLMTGPVLMPTPAFTRAGWGVQALPIAVLRLGAKAETIQFYGNFDQVMPFPSVRADFSDSAIDRLGKSGNRHGPGSGWLLTTDVRLQAKVSVIAARYTWTGQRSTLSNAGTAVGYYDQTLDTLAPVDGWTFVHDSDLLVAPDDKPWVVGARHTATDPIYDGDDLEATHRVGPLAAWKFAETDSPRFNQPALLLISQWHVVHPSRTGQDVSQAIPYFVLAFAFKGDLIES